MDTPRPGEPAPQARVAAVRGTVVDIDMAGALPFFATALRCRLSDDRWVTAVIHSHLGGPRVRAIALGSTRGPRRGARVDSSGGPVTVPVGRAVLGRVIDLEGDGRSTAARRCRTHRGGRSTRAADGRGAAAVQLTLPLLVAGTALGSWIAYIALRGRS